MLTWGTRCEPGILRYMAIPPLVIATLEATRWLGLRTGLWPKAWP